MNTQHASEKQILEINAVLPVAPNGEPFYVVGIGASAGGLEALEQFFEHMPEDSRLCFVVVQHLSPDFKSMMDELLARRTRIPIVRVEDGIELRPNAIFLMPPRKEMIQSAGRLFLTDKDPSQGFALPIDRFLRSLAQDFGSRSIGVILSGTGSDGSRGIRDIHEAGGLIVAQSEESAKFDGMPRSARETGLVDLVLPAADMPDAILKLVRLRRSPELGSDELPSVPEVGLQAIFRMLRAEYGIDFSQYKPSTVTRRVERRLLLNQSLDVEQYVERLAENSAELNQLYKDLLIGVTQFFRDREAFHRLAIDELPRLLAAVEDDQEFRVWVAGCATGEEAYSLAILIHEQLSTMNRQPTVRIFATDAHRASLDIASVGIYSEEALNAVSPQRREQFFVRKGDGFQVVPHIRKMIVFAPHDLLKDAPFTRLDLISCRNLLIYLQPSAQKKVLSLFHFGLKAGGVMFMGPSESPGDLSDEFEPVDDHWKVYRKRRDVRLRPDFRLLLPSGPPQRPRINMAYASSAAASDRLQQAVYDRLLEEHMPPSFLINDRKELVHSFGGAGKYLRVRDGRATTQLLELVDSELKMILLGALARAEKQLVPVVFTGIRVPSEEGGESLTRLTVKPLHDRISGLTSFLIILEEMEQHAPPRDEAAIDLGVASREQIHALEQELGHTRENLQAMIEEQESSNEELQATNEELVASNEQLQSTNEELHSVNEELYTVNAEYQHKIEELTQVTADLENLLLATDVGILFLDRNLCIRRFTPRIGKLFNLLPQDIGRPITGFTNLLDEPLIDSLQQVLDCGTPVEKEIHDRDGNCYFLRILSYRISAAALDGVVLSLIDISPLKKAESNLQQAIRNRDHFLAMLSHELRNPLGAILNAAQILDQTTSNDERSYAASQVVRRQSEQMRLLLDDLLDVARVTQNKIVLRRQDCLLSEVISDAMDAVQPLVTARERRLDVIGIDSAARVDGDPARLQQVLINLLKNAAKYSPPGGTISVRLSEEDGQAIIRVKDNGVGISVEMLGRVFDLFVQSNETLDRADGGMGVGLTLVKAIVELHGGSVVAASAGHNQGSEFTVRLPLLTCAAVTPPRHAEPSAASDKSRCFRIAIVEDNADSRSTLQSLLQLDGHEVRAAADGLQGIELILEWRPEVALIDIGLPGLDGFEVAQRIRANQLTPIPYLVALTGYGFPADREKAIAAGFDVHLVKPLKRAELHSLLVKVGRTK